MGDTNMKLTLIKETTRNIGADEYLISLDVVSLYPNVPVNTSLELVEDRSDNIPTGQV